MAKKKKTNPKKSAKTAKKRSKSKQKPKKSFSQQLKEKRPVIQFLGLFILFVALYYIGIASGLTEGLLESYTKWTASVSAFVLSILGENASSSGYMLTSDRFMLMVGVGCEGSEPIALYLSAIIAFPLAWKWKWQGILAGTVTLFLLNLFRILGLYYSGIFFRDLFEMLHSEIFPIIFIFIAMILWLIWVNWALKKHKKAQEAAT